MAVSVTQPTQKKDELLDKTMGVAMEFGMDYLQNKGGGAKKKPGEKDDPIGGRGTSLKDLIDASGSSSSNPRDRRMSKGY